MKKQGEQQFHPSRDVHNRPPEYSIPYPNKPGVELHPGGWYEGGEPELQQAKHFWIGEGALEHPEVMADARAHFQPVQGRLFDVEKHEQANVQKLGRQRLMLDLGEAEHTGVGAVRRSTLQESRIPSSHLQSRPTRIDETRLTASNDGKPWTGSGMAGFYRHTEVNEALKNDVIAFDPSRSRQGDTIVHELGHRRHLAELSSRSEYVSHPRGTFPDPLKEAVADAYVDRYGGPRSEQVQQMKGDVDEGRGQKFTSYNFTGYSAAPDVSTRRGWNNLDRALYSATRGHASETGEQALYQPRGRHVMELPGSAEHGGGDPTIDATLHGLLSSSPHAAQALRQTGLKDVGAAAFRRHRDRQLLGQGQEVQESLFHELKGVETGKVHGYTAALDAHPRGSFGAAMESYDTDIDTAEARSGEGIWPQHMNKNQFGEAPRTQTDVNASLGVGRTHSKLRGFPSV